MIAFMVIAAPRSGTAWAANWLTTDTTLCIHEPLTRWSQEQLDGIASTKTLGIACTVLARSPDFVNAHPARKVILHRPEREVRASMANLRIAGDYDFRALDRIEGRHCDWRELFTDPGSIYTYLLGKAFDAERHRELVGMNVQNDRVIGAIQRRQRENARAFAHA